MDMDSDSTEKPDCFVIRATNVPLDFFENRDAAKKYFRRFGKVKLVMFKPKRRALVVEYANEDGMLNALEVAGEYNGQVFNVVKEDDHSFKKKKKREPDPDWVEDPDVRAELEAMGAYGPPRVYNLRGEAMVVDSIESAQLSKAKQRKRRGTSGSPKPQKKKVLTGKETSTTAEEADLVQLLKTQALTVEDKYRLLDARDKLVRIKLKRKLEVAKASATVGTCPDMCPEKERLMREAQHQVALYEQDEGKEMNPRLAVKQYSRSSADQEAPLPQELRPVLVLQMTMGYLLHRIIGLCETPDVNIAEWYHFLWDRTRGIRKDITQQELCCQGSVELVEQCARFHIVCSARLVAEDPSVFDQKINTENLTKCLQTLKYMYHDLQLKGVSCQNEAEFRAYIILLNLNDGNFMWEVQQLKEEIQKSKEVRFALDIYSSLDKQNYVKFFKLVNSTTYLNACILVRYFIQVRISAIKTFLKSYSPRTSQASLPVFYLTNILAFESNKATIEFIESYGLYTNSDRNRIILDRPSFSLPEYPYVLDRAIKLVESKRKLSISEVVCGRQLPPKLYENHIPQNSFNNEGYLKFDLEVDKTDFSMKREEKEAPVKQSTFSPKPPQHNIFTQPWIAPPVTRANIFSSVTPTQNVFMGDGKKNETLQKPPEPKIDTPLEVKIEQQRKEEELLRRKQLQEEEERIRKLAEDEKKLEEMRISLSMLVEQKLVEQKRLEEERKAAAAAIKKKLLEEEEHERREQERVKERERIKNLEIQAAVKIVMGDLIDVVEEKVKEEKLAEIAQRLYQRKLQNVINKWRENTRRKRKRKAIDFSPFWGGNKTVQETAEEFRIGSLEIALTNIKRYKKGQQFEIPLNEKQDIGKIDLAELTYKLLTKKFLELNMKLHNELFWKVTVSLPNELEYNCGLNHVEKVLESCIGWKAKGKITVAIQQTKSIPTITYCLEKQKGLPINSRSDTNGFVFLANNFNDNLCKRIITSFKNCGKFTKIPAVFALESYNENNTKLKTLIDQGIISDYLIIVDIFSTKNLVNIIEEALIFLSTRIEKSPSLQMDTLKSFLNKHLCTDLWNRANSFSKWNTNYKNCLKTPNTTIYLHNEALDRLKKILINKNYSERFKFPAIFKEFLRSEIPDSLPCDYKYFPNFWDSPTYIEHIEEILNSLYLPKFLEEWPLSNQFQLELAISKYCKKILKEPERCYYKIMSILLKNIHPDVNFKDISNVVWSDIIELVALEKLEQTNFSFYGTGFVKKSVYNQLIVVYDSDLLKEHVRSDWFYINNPIIKHKIMDLLKEEKQKVIEIVEDECLEFDIDKAWEKLEKYNIKDANKYKSKLSDCKNLLNDLEDTVAMHRRILKKSGQLLKNMIDDN